MIFSQCLKVGFGTHYCWIIWIALPFEYVPITLLQASKPVCLLTLMQVT